MEQAMDFCTVLRRSLHVHVNFSASDKFPVTGGNRKKGFSGRLHSTHVTVIIRFILI